MPDKIKAVVVSEDRYVMGWLKPCEAAIRHLPGFVLVGARLGGPACGLGCHGFDSWAWLVDALAVPQVRERGKSGRAWASDKRLPIDGWKVTRSRVRGVLPVA
jgi:hypothetical protein